MAFTYIYGGEGLIGVVEGVVVAAFRVMVKGEPGVREMEEFKSVG